ncbi:glycoside hydrolase family 43 protein [Exidia glandulosa HHB12029]|uniref:Arabinan endo-1,5-alpha-L-arabinosidase n=1 Tax=Exidia glandulosa HHB12029 TaxID=1314781 RepID=A0A166ALZ7_EXIGL|nr:glycoside hydrolase family 43 protein [Exidia glandulosa HHB12029]
MKLAIIANAVIYAAMFVSAVPGPISGSTNVAVRDPTMWYNAKLKKYFLFSTGVNIRLFHSPSLKGPWTRDGTVLKNCSKIDFGDRCNPWAPDVSFHNGTYNLFYSVSKVGSATGVIGLATSPSMKRGTWTDHGEVFRSRPGFIGIDPNYIDFEGPKLVFGSHLGGIFMASLRDNLLKPKYANMPRVNLAGGKDRAVEGAVVYKPKSSKYYYLFFSEGVTLLNGNKPPKGTEYKVLVGRSTSAKGPFVDKNGHKLTEKRTPATGSLVLGSHDNIYAPGGQSVFFDPVSGADVIVYHYVKNNNLTAPATLGINYLSFKTGWPVIVKDPPKKQTQKPTPPKAKPTPQPEKGGCKA